MSMKKRILCFGDSNTWGYNAVDASRFDERIRWTALVQKELGDEYEVIEEGQNGRTTVRDDHVENRLSGLTCLRPCMESHAPFDLIVIMLGTNDTKTYFSMSPQDIADGAGTLASIALHCPYGPEGKAPKVLLVSPIAVAEDNPYDGLFGEQAALKTRGFLQAYSKTAEKLNCAFLDAAEYAAPGKVDGVHLDEAGHRALAEAMSAKIRELIG